ncbi:hypothetical protein Prudu_018834 [Prunus dulcis]|uniref:Gnk2-homologous domain-containing protein n=1 Tax=Prunus dulcis TaxID=3755 RepID=A0A4Y1RRU5_PRUDU|nr:hypothetical protein Prudu_018834 [Prunus dulcis]
MMEYAHLQLITAGNAMILAPTQQVTSTKRTSTASSLPSPPTPKSIPGLTIHPGDKTPTRSMQLHYAEEISYRTLVRLVSTSLLLFSCKIVQLIRKQSIWAGFNNSSRGQDPNKINAIALCRGDLLQDSCQACLNKSTVILLQNCSTHKEAIIWAERCMVRYSYNLIFGIEQTDPLKHVPSPNYPKNPQQFEPVLTHLLGNLSDRAASTNSLKKFAAGHATVPGGEPIYALAQCTPDIDKQNCSSCLKQSVTEIQTCCGGRNGGRVLKPSCNLRYENYSFFASTVDSLVDIPAPVPAAPAPKEGTYGYPAYLKFIDVLQLGGMVLDVNKGIHVIFRKKEE